MKKVFRALILISCLIFITSLFASDLSESVPEVPANARAPRDTLFDVGLTRIINATFRDQYEEAVRVADSMIKVYPDHPAPYFFKAATLQGWMSTYRISNFQDEMEKNTQKAIEVGDALLEKEYNPWLHFYVGGAYGYRGFNRFRKLNFIGAYRDAQRGINHFEEALGKDSTLYDVYLGLGSYYYWRTAKSKFLRLITFWMPDKRELGMDQLNFVIHHGRYAIYESIYVLLAAYYNEGMYDKGLQLVNEAIQEKESPNLTDLYFKGRFLVLNGNWPEVQKTFTTILDRISDYKYPSIGYQVECKYWIARALDQQGQEREALFTARDALMLSRKRDSDKEIEGHIDSFDDIKNELEKFHNELNDRLMKQR